MTGSSDYCNVCYTSFADEQMALGTSMCHADRGGAHAVYEKIVAAAPLTHSLATVQLTRDEWQRVRSSLDSITGKDVIEKIDRQLKAWPNRGIPAGAFNGLRAMKSGETMNLMNGWVVEHRSGMWSVNGGDWLYINEAINTIIELFDVGAGQ